MLESINIKNFGENNIVNFHNEFSSFDKINFVMSGDDNVIEIGNINILKRGKLVISINGDKNFVKIESEVVINHNVSLTTTDNHGIYDINTLQRVNKGGNIKLGEIISSVANNCVVATKSLVSKHLIDENCVYGGIPAKCIKRNVNWDRQLKNNYGGRGERWVS